MGKKDVLGEKPVPILLRWPKTSYGMPRDGTWGLFCAKIVQ